MTRVFPPLLRLSFAFALLALSACDKPAPPIITGQKIGKPYVINGKTYFPEYDPTYDKIGMASWYGPGFHGRSTANGERFDQEGLTAAHPTLPMPSIVRVTNLRTGKSLIVRINDRGPFKSNRIIDLSKKSAEELGIPSTAEVRVQYLHPETEQYLASARLGQQPDLKTINENAEEVKEASIIRSTEPSEQIVESTVVVNRPGQIVDASAPILTVASSELQQDKKAVVEPDDSTVVTPLVKVQYVDYPEDTAVKANTVPPGSVTPVELTQDTHTISDSLTVVTTNSADTPASVPFKPSKDTVSVKKTSSSNAGAASKDGVYIQAGSFSSQQNAQKLSGVLSSLGPIDIGKVDMNDKIWWRVRLGPFGTLEAAKNALEKVRALNIPDARIIPH